MADYRTYFDNDFLAAWDLGGQDVTLTIQRVAAGAVQNGSGTTKKIIIQFAESPKGMVMNKTNARVVAALYSNDTSAWVGRRVTLYPTTTEMEGATKDCIRIRPMVPSDVTTPVRTAQVQAPPPMFAPPAPPPIEANVIGRDATPAQRANGKKAQRAEARRG